MQYLSKHNKSYPSLDEFNQRLQNFARVDAFIEEWNSNEENSSKVGHNYFSDLSDEERSGKRETEPEIGMDSTVLMHNIVEN